MTGSFVVSPPHFEPMQFSVRHALISHEKADPDEPALQVIPQPLRSTSEASRRLP